MMGATTSLDFGTERGRVSLELHQDVIRARRFGRECASELGFGLADQTRLATVISELSRNVLQNAERGECVVYSAVEPDCVRITVLIIDEGPGIPDLQKAMTDGYSTTGGLGVGLPAARRLMHDFSIDTAPGRTEIRVGLRRRRVR